MAIYIRDKDGNKKLISGGGGSGAPAGGTEGQILAKQSDEDFDTTWIDPPDADDKVSKSGDTMTGTLTTPMLNLSLGTKQVLMTPSPLTKPGVPVMLKLSGNEMGDDAVRISGVADPSSNDQAANKNYVDTSVDAVSTVANAANEVATQAQSAAEAAQTSADGKVSKTGDTMSGGLTVPTVTFPGANNSLIFIQKDGNNIKLYPSTTGLEGDPGAIIRGVATPQDQYDAATKKYVDDAVAAAGGGDYLPLTGGTLSGQLALNTNSSEQIRFSKNMASYSAGISCNQDALISLTRYTGDIITGRCRVTGVATPTGQWDVANKAYVDNIIDGSVYEGTETLPRLDTSTFSGITILNNTVKNRAYLVQAQIYRESNTSVFFSISGCLIQGDEYNYSAIFSLYTLTNNTYYGKGQISIQSGKLGVSVKLATSDATATDYKCKYIVKVI